MNGIIILALACDCNSGGVGDVRRGRLKNDNNNKGRPYYYIPLAEERERGRREDRVGEGDGTQEGSNPTKGGGREQPNEGRREGAKNSIT